MLTPRQSDMLRFIKIYLGRHDYAPTLQEINDGLGMRSKSGVHRILGELEDKGVIRRVSLRNRGIELVHGSDQIDAARYRWLRARDLDTIERGGVFIGMTPKNVVLNGADCDAAVDAGMKGEG